ncbi:MAG: DUF4625 domain-containing protein [Sphingobacteriales bacterium]|nr:MAG: DUF4625 domain-containing protein [Sphingobacteriales bacterium]
MNKLFPILLLALLSQACSKDSAGSNDNEVPLVSILTPTAGQQFAAGQTISITGQLSDNNKLSEVHVHISNVQTGALLIDIHRYPDAVSYTLAESFSAAAGIN